MDNNVVLIIALIAVLVFFFYSQQQTGTPAPTPVPSPEEESVLPPLPDFRKNEQVQQALDAAEDQFRGVYTLCVKGCEAQGSSTQECTSQCRSTFEAVCEKIDEECASGTTDLKGLCTKDCQDQGYPADQCDAYCEDAMGYLCDEMDENCQAGVTPV